MIVTLLDQYFCLRAVGNYVVITKDLREKEREREREREKKKCVFFIYKYRTEVYDHVTLLRSIRGTVV